MHLQAILSQVLPKGSAKFACHPLACGILGNLIIEALGCFYHHLFITHLALYFQNLGAPLFQAHLPVAVSAYTCLNVTPKKSTKILK